MASWTLLPLLLALGASAPKTVVDDEAAAKKLRGSHGLRLQWVEAKPGAAKVVVEKGTYRLTGEQRSKNGNFVRIDGVITRVKKKRFELQGTVVTRVDHIADGKECVREGKLSFRISGRRKYWRLKQNDNPCSSVTDYVNLMFSPPSG